MFDTFVTPAAGWRPPRSSPAPQPPASDGVAKPDQRDWEDAALAEDWQEAVVGFLRERRREAVPYWEVVNSVAVASRQPDRWEHRFATRGILRAIKALSHERRILRYRREYLSILDLDSAVVSLEVYRAIHNRYISGQRSADSTACQGSVKTT